METKKLEEKNKKIAIDIDDTVADSTNFLMNYAIEFDKKYFNGEGVVDASKDITRCFNWSSDDTKLFFDTIFDKYVDNIIPIKNSVEVINDLKSAGYEIIFVSSRNESQMRNPYERSLNWLIKNNFQFDKLIVKARYKGPILAEERANFFIDDSIGQTSFVADNYDINVILFSKKNIQHDNINVIYDWNEISNYIKNKDRS